LDGFLETHEADYSQPGGHKAKAYVSRFRMAIEETRASAMRCNAK
jgi:hypothetical protein